MASFVHLGPAPAELGHFVAEAVRALGYFREDAIDELTAIYAAKWPKGTSSTMLGRDALHLLSEKGLAQPDGARITTLRITANLQRLHFEHGQPHWDGFSPRLRLWCLEQHACKGAMEMLGRAYPWRERPVLPLVECDKEWCCCDWEFAGE